MGSCVSTAADVQAGYSIPINRRKVGAVPTSDSTFPATQKKVNTSSYQLPPSKKGGGGDIHNDEDVFDHTCSSASDYESETSDYVFDSVSSCSDNVRLRCMLFNASAPNALLPTSDNNHYGGGGGGPSPGSTFVGVHGEMSLLPLYRQQNSTTVLHNPTLITASSYQQNASSASDEGEGNKREGGGGGKRGGSNSNTPPTASTTPGNGDALTPPSDPFIASVHQHVVPMILSGDARLANMIGSRFGAGYCHTLQALRFVKTKNGGPCYNANTGSLIVSSSSGGKKKMRPRNSNTQGSGGVQQPPSGGGSSGSHVKRIQALATSISKNKNNNGAAAYFSFTRDIMCYEGLDKEGLLYPGWKEVELRRRRQYFRRRAQNAARERQSKTGATPGKAKSPNTQGPNNGQTEISSVLSGKSRNSRKVAASDFSSSSAEEATDVSSEQGGSPLGNTLAGTAKTNNSNKTSNNNATTKTTTALSIPRPPLRAPVHPRSRYLRYVDVLDSPFIEYGTSRNEMRKYIMSNDYVPPVPTSTDAISSFGIDISVPDLASAIAASCGDEGQLTISGSAYPTGLLSGGGGSGSIGCPEDLIGNFRVLQDEDHFVYDLTDENAPKVTTGGATAANNASAHRQESMNSGHGRGGGTSPSSSTNLPSRQQTMQIPRGSGGGLSPAASPLGLDAPAGSPRGDSSSQLSEDAREIVNRARTNSRRRNSGGSLASSAFESGNLNVRNVLSSDGSNSTLHQAPVRNPIQRAAAKRHRKERMYVTFGETCKYEVDDLRHPGMKSQEQQLGGLAGVTAPSSPLTQRAMAARGAATTTGAPSSPTLHNHDDSDPDGASLDDEAGSRSNTDDGAPAEEAPCSWAISRKFQVLKTFVQHGINSDPDQFTKCLEEDSVLMHRRDVVRIAMWIDDILQLALLNHLSQIATKSCPNPLEDFYGSDYAEDAASAEEIPRPGTQAPASPTTGSIRQRRTRSNSVGWVGDNTSDTTNSLITLSKVTPGGNTNTTHTPTSAFVPGVSCHPVIRAVTFAAGMRGRRRVRKHVRVLRLKCTTQAASKKDPTTAPLIIDGIPRISANNDLIRKTGGLELDSIQEGGNGDRGDTQLPQAPGESNSPIASSSPNLRNNTTTPGGGGLKPNAGSSFASSRKSAMMDSYGETHSSNFRGGGKGGGSGSGHHVNTDATSDSAHNTTHTGGRAEALDIDVTVVAAPPRLSFLSNTDEKKSGSSAGEFADVKSNNGNNNPLQGGSIMSSSMAPVSSVKSCVEVMSIRPPKKTIRRLFDVRLRCAPDISAHVDIKALFRAVNNFATSVHFSTTVASAAQQQQGGSGGGGTSMGQGGGSFHLVPSKNAPPQTGFLGTAMTASNNNNNIVTDPSGGSFNASGSDMLTFALPKSSPSLLTVDNKPAPPTFNTTNGLLAVGNSGNINKTGQPQINTGQGSPSAGSPSGFVASSSSQRSQDTPSKQSGSASTAPTSLVLPPGLLHNGGVVVSSPFVSLLPPIIFELQQLCLVANNPMRDVGTTSYMCSDTNIPLVSLLTGVSKGITNLGDAAIISSALKTVDFPLGEFVLAGPSTLNSDDDDDDDGVNDNITDQMTIASTSPTSNYHGGLQSASTSSMSQVPIRGMSDPNNSHIHHLTIAQRNHQFVLQGILARLQTAAISAASTSTGGGRIGNNQQGRLSSVDTATTILHQQHQHSVAVAPSTTGAPITVLQKPVIVTPSSTPASKTGSPKGSPKGSGSMSETTQAGSHNNNNNAPLATLLPGSANPDSPTKLVEGSGVGDTLQISLADPAAVAGASWSMADGQHQSTSVPLDAVQHIQPNTIPVNNTNIITTNNNNNNNRGNNNNRSSGAGDLLDESLVSPHTHHLQSSTASGIIHLQVPVSSPLGNLAGNSISSVNNHSRSQNTPGSLKSQAAPNPTPDPAALFAWKERTMTADALKAYIKYQQFLAKQRKKEDSIFERRLLATPPSIRQLVFGPVPYSRAIVRPGLLSPNQLAMQQHQQQLLASLAGSFSNLPAASQAASDPRQHCFYDTLTQDEGSDVDAN